MGDSGVRFIECSAKHYPLDCLVECFYGRYGALCQKVVDFSVKMLKQLVVIPLIRQRKCKCSYSHNFSMAITHRL